MLKIVFSVSFLLLVSDVSAEKQFSFNFYQNDYHLTPEWAEIVRYDKKYIKDVNIKVFKYNRTQGALNVSMEMGVDFGNDLSMVGQVYKFMSNEYRYFPVRLQVNFCTILGENILGIQDSINYCGNFSGCPLRKNKRFYICKWTPDESKMPPLMPNGRYMLEVQGMYNSVETIVIRCYAAINSIKEIH